MLDQSMSMKPGPKQPLGPRQSGQTVTNPRAQLAIALANAASNSGKLSSDTLTQALMKKKKKAS